MNRRLFLAAAAAATGWLAGGSRARTAETAASTAAVVAAGQRYKMGVCAWMILRRQKLGAFQPTNDLGANTAYLTSTFQAK